MKKENFVTFFDYGFLPQGICLYHSLLRNYESAFLWVLCLDDDTLNFFENSQFLNLKALSINLLDREDLKLARMERSWQEYCWTLTPFVPDLILRMDSQVERVTYIDADMYFINNCISIFEEFDNSGRDVMITEHAYQPEYDRSFEFGKYCVQFMIFKRSSFDILHHWQNSCIEWCYNRVESNRFGDQKYLDYWSRLFPNRIHVLKSKASILAPWNFLRFTYSEAVVVHFHNLKYFRNNFIYLGKYLVPSVVYEYVYLPYLNEIRDVIGTNQIEIRAHLNCIGRLKLIFVSSMIMFSRLRLYRMKNVIFNVFNNKEAK
jgi:hypothetical protein